MNADMLTARGSGVFRRHWKRLGSWSFGLTSLKSKDVE